MIDQLTYDNFANEIKQHKLTLVIFSTKSFPDPQREHPKMVPESINYLYISPDQTHRLESRLNLKKLPAIRLYYKDPELFSELNFPFKHIQKMNVPFEISDFLKRKLRKSIVSESINQKEAYLKLKRYLSLKKGFLTLIMDSKLDFCDFQKYRLFINENLVDDGFGKDVKAKYIKNIQKVYITLSRIMSPVPSFFIRNSDRFLAEIGNAFDGIDLSSQFFKNSKYEAKLNLETSKYFRNLTFENIDMPSSVNICQGVFFYDFKTKALHPISVFDLFEDINDIVSPIKRISKILKEKLSNAIPEFPYVDYKALFQLESKNFLFVNTDFMNIMMQDSTKKYINNKLSKLSNEGTSKNTIS
jgi:hypothetical protein